MEDSREEELLGSLEQRAGRGCRQPQSSLGTGQTGKTRRKYQKISASVLDGLVLLHLRLEMLGVWAWSQSWERISSWT